MTTGNDATLRGSAAIVEFPDTKRPWCGRTGRLSTAGTSEFPVATRVIVARGTSLQSAEIPFDVKEEQRRRENLIANRGEPVVSTWGDD